MASPVVGVSGAVMICTKERGVTVLARLSSEPQFDGRGLVRRVRASYPARGKDVKETARDRLLLAKAWLP